MSENAHIVAAIRRFGSEAKLASAVNLSQPAIHKAKKAARISAELAAAIHDVTNGDIPKWEMRSDLWDEPGYASAPVEHAVQP